MQISFKSSLIQFTILQWYKNKTGILGAGKEFDNIRIHYIIIFVNQENKGTFLQNSTANIHLMIKLS